MVPLSVITGKLVMRVPARIQSDSEQTHDIVDFCKSVQALAATHESLRLAYSEAGAQLLKMQEQKRTSAYNEVRIPYSRTMTYSYNIFLTRNMRSSVRTELVH